VRWIDSAIGIATIAYFGRFVTARGAARQAVANAESGRRVAATQPGTVRAIGIGFVVLAVLLIAFGLAGVL
jgi:hypothetical protein